MQDSRLLEIYERKEYFYLFTVDGDTTTFLKFLQRMFTGWIFNCTRVMRYIQFNLESRVKEIY